MPCSQPSPKKRLKKGGSVPPSKKGNTNGEKGRLRAGGKIKAHIHHESQRGEKNALIENAEGTLTRRVGERRKGRKFAALMADCKRMQGGVP